jgi:hypothetical protein
MSLDRTGAASGIQGQELGHVFSTAAAVKKNWLEAIQRPLPTAWS